MSASASNKTLNTNIESNRNDLMNVYPAYDFKA